MVAIILVNTVTWSMNEYVIKGIYNVNQKLRLITDGNLNEKLDIQNSLEFSELSKHINELIKSLLSSTDKISYVLSQSNTSIGVYEYNEKMKQVRFTEYIPKIFSFNRANEELFSSDCHLFKEYLEQIRANPLSKEEKIYILNNEERYVRMEEITNNGEVLGVVIDVTKDILLRKKIEGERDVDLLTGLYNRRGLEYKLANLFTEPDYLGYGALIMIDADDLKGINDRYGHEKGDRYLKKISDVISSFGQRSCIASRYGGDEFVLFLYHYSSEEELLNSLETLTYIQNNSTAYLDDTISVPLRFSYGYSFTKGQHDYQMLLSKADEKMYQNKRERKKKIQNS